jgi:serine phosphatase RsbU (regulator of sigma subunit)
VSDGIFEARNPANEHFEMHRVIRLLDESKSVEPHALSATLRTAVQDWQGHDEPVDDQTVVVVRRPA